VDGLYGRSLENFGVAPSTLGKFATCLLDEL
jgi:hypothetical protein